MLAKLHLYDYSLSPDQARTQSQGMTGGARDENYFLGCLIGLTKSEKCWENSLNKKYTSPRALHRERSFT